VRETGRTGGQEIGTTYAGPTEGDRRAYEDAAETPANHDGRPETGEVSEAPTNHLGYKDRPVGEFRNQYPDEYIEPDNPTTDKVEPFSDPHELADRVNPNLDHRQEYRRNCADCARSFERGWRGNVEEAAGRARQFDSRTDTFRVPGESAVRTEEWAGERFSDVYDPKDLRLRMQTAGHGSSAIVATTERGGLRGHAYNVVNYQGEVHVVDPQHHKVLPWTEGSIHPALPETSRHQAMAWDAKGQRIW
jgi:hypothetical protein